MDPTYRENGAYKTLNPIPLALAVRLYKLVLRLTFRYEDRLKFLSNKENE
jgi:hypothetical protein